MKDAKSSITIQQFLQNSFFAVQLLFAHQNLLFPEIRGKSTRKKTTTSRMGRKKSGAKSGRGQDLTGRLTKFPIFLSRSNDSNCCEGDNLAGYLAKPI